MAKILIAGCGDVGYETAKLLLADGHEVSAIKRHPLDDESIHWIAADLTNIESLQSLKDEYEAVIYLPTPSEYNEEGYRRIFVEGLKNVLAQLPKTREKALCCFVSSTAVYGQSQGEWVDETSLTEPERYNGQVLLAAENTLKERVSHPCVLRLGGIYGPGRERLIRLVKEGKPVQKTPPAYTNRIQQQDAARLLAFLVGCYLKGKSLQSCYLGVDSAPVSAWEVQSWLADALGLPLIESDHDENKQAQNKRCSNQRILDLGFTFQYPSYKEGYAEMLEIMKTK